LWQGVKDKIATMTEHHTPTTTESSSQDPKERYNVHWDPLLVACLDASIAKASGDAGWEAYQAELASRPFTLVHGDFHPANLLYDIDIDLNMDSDKDSDGDRDEGNRKASRVLLLDWEATGLGSGPQELGQFVISHTEPALLQPQPQPESQSQSQSQSHCFSASVEQQAVQAYYSELTTLNPHIASTMTYAECWAEYVAGGLGRWLFFLPYDGWGAPTPAVSQFFCDQVTAFIKRHGVTPDNVPMPRV